MSVIVKMSTRAPTAEDALDAITADLKGIESWVGTLHFDFARYIDALPPKAAQAIDHSRLIEITREDVKFLRTILENMETDNA